MSGLCGWVGWESTADDKREVLDRMARRLQNWDGGQRSLAMAGSAAIAVAGHDKPPEICEDSGVLAVVVGEPRWASSNDSDPAGRRAGTDDILAAYLREGEAVLDAVRGAFALAIVSGKGGDALLAIDRIGGRFPLRFKVIGSTVVFSTSGDSIQAHPLGRSEIDPQGIYNYLYFHVTPSPRTARKDVEQIPPAGYLKLRDGTARTGTYWKATYRDDDKVDVPELCEEFRSVMRQCVSFHAGDAPVGCFLSGGTDSSTIVGYLGQVTGVSPRTYSIGFDAAGYDEMEYARTAVAEFDAVQHEYYVKPQDVLDLIPRVAGAYSDPFGNASTVPAFYCARLARQDGIERMLGGDGGDELFAGNERYAEQHVFGVYDRLPRAFRPPLEFLVSRFPWRDRITPVRKAGSYIAQAKIPMPHRLQSYNYFERQGVRRILDPDFLASVDPGEPRELQAQVYDTANAGTMLNRMLALDMKFTIADDDLQKVSRMCHMAGIDVGYPFLDDEMVEFSCRIPARLKLKGLQLRWFFKHALRDFLPEKILSKSKHGFGLPFGLWMREHGPLKEFAHSNLESMKHRKLVRADYIDEVIRLHETDHAAYYGVMIWILMMLEQWFQLHETT